MSGTLDSYRSIGSSILYWNY